MKFIILLFYITLVLVILVSGFHSKKLKDAKANSEPKSKQHNQFSKHPDKELSFISTHSLHKSSKSQKNNFSKIIKQLRSKYGKHEVIYMETGQLISGGIDIKEGLENVEFYNNLKLDSYLFNTNSMRNQSFKEMHTILAKTKFANIITNTLLVQYDRTQNYGIWQDEYRLQDREKQDRKIYEFLSYKQNNLKVCLFGITTTETDDNDALKKLNYRYVEVVKQYAYQMKGIYKCRAIIVYSNVGISDCKFEDNKKEEITKYYSEFHRVDYKTAKKVKCDETKSEFPFKQMNELKDTKTPFFSPEDQSEEPLIDAWITNEERDTAESDTKIANFFNEKIPVIYNSTDNSKFSVINLKFKYKNNRYYVDNREIISGIDENSPFLKEKIAGADVKKKNEKMKEKKAKEIIKKEKAEENSKKKADEKEKDKILKKNEKIKLKKRVRKKHSNK